MKKIRCNSNPTDFLAVSVFAGCAYIDTQQGDKSTEIELSPDKIRKLRKQLKRALIEIEGDKDEGDDWFSVGKKVKIVDRLSGHGFQIGQIVKYVGTTPMGNEKLESLDGSNWYAVHKNDCAPA